MCIAPEHTDAIDCREVPSFLIAIVRNMKKPFLRTLKHCIAFYSRDSNMANLYVCTEIVSALTRTVEAIQCSVKARVRT